MLRFRCNLMYNEMGIEQTKFSFDLSRRQQLP
eukprot:COSAG05_NODE_18051_length_314_cov_13.548837_1_plen_31_part_01